MELTRQQIAQEAANHARFDQNDVDNYWTVRAESYARQYDLAFPFMLDIQAKVNAGSKLTPGQVKAVLNCARKEGQVIKTNNTPVPETPDFIVPVKSSSIEMSVQELEQYEADLESKDDEVVFDFSPDEDYDTQAAETDPHYDELNKINAKIREIQESIQSLTPSLTHLEELIKESEKDEEIYLDEVQRRIAEMRTERQVSQDERARIAVELAKIKEELENQRRLHALTLQQIAAEKEYEKVKKQFDELRIGQPWDKDIMPFQWNDVQFMAANFLADKNGVLNANDMGLGKTFESGALADILTPLFVQKYDRLPLMLWLTKKTLRFTTFEELRKWNPERQIIVLDGNETAREFQLELAVATNTMVIANYDMLNTTSISKYDWDFVFMDEVHKLKGGANSKPTQVFVNTKEICHKAKFIVPLSGSPIQNHPKEMWCYLHIFDPDRFPDVRHFERNYCFGWGQVDEDGNPIVSVDWEKIIRAMKDRVIRHSKEEVLTDLPELTRDYRYVELEGKQLEIYTQLRTEFFTWLDDQKELALTFTAVIAQLTRLRQAALIPSSMKLNMPDGTFKHVDCNESAKLDEAMELIEQYVGAGEQTVVFTSQFNEPVFELSKRLTAIGITSGQIIGATSNKHHLIQKAFQQKEFDVLLVNLKSGGEGLNFQKSDQWPGGSNNVIFLDLWWNPAANEQAEARVHRKGQRDAVTSHIIQAQSSVDAFIAAKLEMKENMIEGIMETDDLRKAGDWKEYLQGMI